MSEWLLLFLSGPRRGKVIPIPRQGQLSLGTSPDMNIVLSAPGIAEYHAKIDRCGIMAMGAQYRTYVNGQPVTEVRLQPGDIITVGVITLQWLNDRQYRMGRKGGTSSADTWLYWRMLLFDIGYVLLTAGVWLALLPGILLYINASLHRRESGIKAINNGLSDDYHRRSAGITSIAGRYERAQALLSTHPYQTFSICESIEQRITRGPILEASRKLMDQALHLLRHRQYCPEHLAACQEQALLPVIEIHCQQRRLAELTSQAKRALVSRRLSEARKKMAIGQVNCAWAICECTQSLIETPAHQDAITVIYRQLASKRQQSKGLGQK